jgi:hypothetical protein
MHVEYEFSEKDYLAGRRLAAKDSSGITAQWNRLVAPLVAAGLVVAVIYITLTQGLSAKFIPALVLGLLVVLLSLLSRRRQKAQYARSNPLPGKTTLDADDSGIQFSGPVASGKVAWAYYGRFCEDEKSFLLIPLNKSNFQIVPKRAFSPEQVVRFRQYLEQNIRIELMLQSSPDRRAQTD